MNEKAIVKKTPDEEAFELVQRKAKVYATSTMVPTVFQGNLSNCIIAMELAGRLRASVFALMQKMYIIGGKPAFEATFLIGTVNTSGRFTPIRYKFEGKENTDSWGCRAVATDKDSKEECIGPLVTIKMSKDEGWYDKKDKKGNYVSKWRTMPELMLRYRAAAFWARTFAPELSMGMHTVEELQDTIEVAPATVIDTPPANTLDAVADELEKEQAPEIDVFAELKDKAEEMFGPQWSEELDTRARGQGMNPAQLTEEQASALLDILVEEANK